MISNRLSKLVLLGCVTFSLTALSGISFAQSNISQAPVNFDADNLSHDETGQIITATGSVVMTQAGKTVRADKVTYNLKNDTVIGEGNVVFEDINGDKHYADRVEFQDSMKNGFVQGLQTFLVDGSKFKASSGKHKNGMVTVMKDASYTPCESCEG